jgi:hypothetical protein
VRVVFVVAVASSGRPMGRDVAGLRTLSLAGKSGRRVLPVAGRRAARALVDVSGGAAMCGRPVGVPERTGVRRRAVLRVRERERMPLAVSFVAAREAGRMRLRMPQRQPARGRSLGCCMWRRNPRGCRLLRARGGTGSRLRRGPAVDYRGVMRNRCDRSRRSRGGRRGRRPGRRHGRGSRLRGAVRRGLRGRPMVRVRLCGVRRRSGHDDLLQRRRAEARARADRRQAHRPRVEEQRHRPRAEQQRNRGRDHPSGDTPH